MSGLEERFTTHWFEGVGGYINYVEIVVVEYTSYYSLNNQVNN